MNFVVSRDKFAALSSLMRVVNEAKLCCLWGLNLDIEANETKDKSQWFTTLSSLMRVFVVNEAARS